MIQIVVVAKQPLPGRVKTRLCPPCTPQQACDLAAAALDDTLDTVTAIPAARRVLLLDGDFQPPPGWDVVAQQGDGLAERLARGFVDTRLDGAGTLLVTPADLSRVGDQLSEVDAVLGPAVDGGWWALALREPRHGELLARVPMSRSDTGQLTLDALRGAGLSVALAMRLRDVDTFDDLSEVARACGDGRFAKAVSEI